MTTHNYTPEMLIAQYVYSACLLGNKFAGIPYPAYVDQTVVAILSDLSAHGFEITRRPA